MGVIGLMHERIDLRYVSGIRVHKGREAHYRSRRTLHVQEDEGGRRRRCTDRELDSRL